jgi:DNA-binding CsgD family transcriptional regulator/tetratricopeptide (TPR) repeat protein
MGRENVAREDPMAGRLIGRDAETAQLYDAMTLAAQGEPQLVLVAGDAGIGKTCLVSDLVSRAAELGFATATGHCLDIEAAMSFAPVIEALRSLLSDDPDLDGRPHARRTRAMLDPDAPEPDQIRMLDDLRLTLLEAAADRPLLLVVEDMHWADRSTQDLTSALARTAQGSLLLVITVRDDELHRRHPFRTTLAELSRLETARRVELRPLGPGDIALLVRDRSGVEGSSESVRQIHERSEGNPLYAEELIDADPNAVPEHLADLLLARVSKLSGEGRSLVRTASVDGSRIDTELLAAVSGLDTDTLEKLTRQAVDEHVFHVRGSVLEFRHGLLREAVYDDLLPGERTRTHAAFAEALQSRVDAGEATLPRLSRLAFHWSQAHETRRTLAASVRAGEAALHFGAAESVTHLDRAVSLWDRVPDPATATGRAKPHLLLLLAHAHAENERRDLFELLTREALRELGPDPDPLVASRVYAALVLGRFTADDEIDDAEALRLALEYAGTTPSRELARALTSQSAYHHHRGEGALALEAAEHAAEVARQASAPEHEVEALHFAACELELLGRLREAAACERRAMLVARQAGRLGHALFEQSNLAWFELASGAGEQAYETAITGMEEAATNALPTLTAYCGAQAFCYLVWDGRFNDAERLFQRLAAFDPGTHWDWQAELREQLAVARGDVQEVARFAEITPRFLSSAQPHGGDDVEVDHRVTGLLMLGHPDDACRIAEAYLSFVENLDSPVRHGSAALTAYRAALEHRDDDLTTHADQVLARARGGLDEEWQTTLHGLWFALADAHGSRLRGEPTVTTLRGAVTLASALGRYVALEPRLLLAAELLARHERDEGKELLTAVWSDAKDMGAGDHERRAFKLAIRKRVPLPQEARETGPLDRLTPREREVLDLLADGATNRVIAETLFITEKTASVHVSNLLAKLGVPNRGAAAAVARRFG